MEMYYVKGMSCAACSSRVEKAVSSVKGVTSCSVSLLTNSMIVDGNANSKEIIKAVKSAGYSAGIKQEKYEKDDDREIKTIKNRLIWSVVLTIILMYFSMGYAMWSFPLPAFLSDKIIISVIQCILSFSIMIINRKFFISGFKGLAHLSPNMDTLVSLGSVSAFIYSICVLIFDYKNIHLLHNLYFESAAMVLTLITVGKFLEAVSKGKTTSALKTLISLAPKTATLIIDEKEKQVLASEVKVGDIFIVRPAESIPVDAVIIEGESSVNEAMLTGESVPVDKKTNDEVYSATLNQTGVIKCRAIKVGEDTSLAQIIKIVSQAAATKAPIAKIADKVSGVFVPFVMFISLITFIVWLICDAEISFALSRAISVLVISCPCSLGLATPVAIMVGSGKGAKSGILFKTAAALENIGKIKIAAFDKTGTITEGKPKLTDIYAYGDVKEDSLLQYAASLEKNSEHPLSKSIIEYSIEHSVELLNVTEFKISAGNGLCGKIGEDIIIGGKLEYISNTLTVPNEALKKANEFADAGKTPLFFIKNNTFLGIIAVADTLKSETNEAINELKNQGIQVVMLTGDNKKTADAIGKKAGVDKIFANLLPNKKEKIVAELQKNGAVMMVGDGINDAPALTRADIGVSVASGTDVAIEAADVVLIKNKMTDISASVRLGRAVIKNVHENFFWAFAYNIIGIPLAAGVFIPVFNWTLNPMFAAAAMSFSSVLVVLNALRLNLFNIYNIKNDRKINIKEKKKMTKIMVIEGMMCAHCEARVKKVLEEIDGVISADTSHANSNAVLKLDKEVSNELLINAVENQGYKVIDIK